MALLKRAVGYVRVSTDQQDLNRQIALIGEYCAVNSLNLIKIIGDKESGANATRKGYIELMSLTNEETDLVIMTEVSRLSREDDITMPLANINNILKGGMDIVFLDNNIYNVRKLEGGKCLNIIEVITLAVELDAAAKERKKIVGRMMSGRKEKFSNFANVCIGRIPFGYAKEYNPNFELHKTPKAFLVRNENAAIVSQVFEWVINGMTLKECAKRLRDMQVKTNKGEDIQLGTIAALVHNPIYKGEWTFSGKVIKGDAIVTPEIWEKAQKALSKNKLLNTQLGQRNFNPLRTIFKCPCGHSMYIVKNGTKGNPTHRYYRCATKKNKYDETICSYRGVSADVVLDAVWHAVRCSNNDAEFIERNKVEVIKIDRQITDIEGIINNNNISLKKLEIELKTIAANMVRVNNETLLEMMQKQFEDKETQVKSLKAHNENLGKEKVKLLSLKEQLSISHKVQTELTDEEKAAIYQRLFDKVVYYGEIMHRGFLVINFKNGLQMVYMLLTSGYSQAVQMPSGWEYIAETNKMRVTYMNNGKNPDGSLNFSLETYTKEYNTFDIENIFPDVVADNDIYNKGKLIEEFE